MRHLHNVYNKLLYYCCIYFFMTIRNISLNCFLRFLKKPMVSVQFVRKHAIDVYTRMEVDNNMDVVVCVRIPAVHYRYSANQSSRVANKNPLNADNNIIIPPECAYSTDYVGTRTFTVLFFFSRGFEPFGRSITEDLIQCSIGIIIYCTRGTFCTASPGPRATSVRLVPCPCRKKILDPRLYVVFFHSLPYTPAYLCVCVCVNNYKFAVIS